MIDIQGIPSTGTTFAIVGDAERGTVNVTPSDLRSAPSAFILAASPAGSTCTSAAVAEGGSLTPDIGGVYVVTVQVGLEIRAVTINAFGAGVASTLLASMQQRDAYAGLARVRDVLRGVVNGGISAAQLAAWNTAPYSPPFGLAPFGGV